MTTTQMLTLGTLPGCVRCTMAARWLTRHGIAHTLTDLTGQPDVVAAAKAQGATTAPIIYSREGEQITIHATGFNPAALAGLARG